MLTLSTNTKEAIKIALAMTIAYYVALRFSWLNPTWSGITVAFISLPTAGQSLQKALLRMGGTLLALVAGLFYLGLFPQDRWLFFISFSPYLAFVSYKMTGKNGQYFWFVAAFVSMMIITAGPGSSEHAFNFGMYRTLETLMGIVIWTLVSVFIWPRSNRGALEEISQSILAKHQSFLHDYQACIMGSGSGEKLTIDRSQHTKLLSQFEQTIGAGASESYEVREVRHLWEHLHRLALPMMEGMDRLASGHADLQGINVHRVLPELHMVFSELESRFENGRSMLEGKSSPYLCTAISLMPSGKDFRALDLFQRAAVQLTINELGKLDAQTRSMVACIAEIKGYEKIEADKPTLVTSRPSRPIESSMGLPVLDSDRVRASIMVVVSMWAGALIWIYLDPPGHVSWYQFVPNIVLVVAQTPHLKINFVKPFTYAYLSGLGVYVFIMPKLSMFLELGLVIFLFTFMAAYFFSGIGRVALYLGMFNMFGIHNQQTYDFAAQANTLLFTILALLVVFALSYITRTPRQEKAFLSLVSRYFRSCEFLISHGADTAKSESVDSVLDRFKRAYYRQELLSLPAKLAAWGGQIDKTKFPNTSAEQISNMVATLQILTYRIEELEEARTAPQAAILTEALRDDMREWLVALERKFRKWSIHPEAESAGDLRAQLSAMLGKLNSRFEEVLNSIGNEKISEEEGKNFYQLLGSFRGMSQAAIAYANKAGDIDWVQLREEKF
jgi:uncharacterized membrane protein YccC